MTSVTTSPVQVETEANKAACQAFFAGRYGGRHSSQLGDRDCLWPSGFKHIAHIAYDDIFVRLEGRPSTRHQIAAAPTTDSPSTSTILNRIPLGYRTGIKIKLCSGGPAEPNW